MVRALEIDCPLCGGEGRSEYETARPDYRFGGELVGEMMDCHFCDGYGAVEKPDCPEARLLHYKIRKGLVYPD